MLRRRSARRGALSRAPRPRVGSEGAPFDVRQRLPEPKRILTRQAAVRKTSWRPGNPEPRRGASRLGTEGGPKFFFLFATSQLDQIATSGWRRLSLTGGSRFAQRVAKLRQDHHVLKLACRQIAGAGKTPQRLRVRARARELGVRLRLDLGPHELHRASGHLPHPDQTR
jgi:hypothetical protein